MKLVTEAWFFDLWRTIQRWFYNIRIKSRKKCLIFETKREFHAYVIAFDSKGKDGGRAGSEGGS